MYCVDVTNVSDLARLSLSGDWDLELEAAGGDSDQADICGES